MENIENPFLGIRLCLKAVFAVTDNDIKTLALGEMDCFSYLLKITPIDKIEKKDINCSKKSIGRYGYELVLNSKSILNKVGLEKGMLLIYLSEPLLDVFSFHIIYEYIKKGHFADGFNLQDPGIFNDRQNLITKLLVKQIINGELCPMKLYHCIKILLESAIKMEHSMDNSFEVIGLLNLNLLLDAIVENSFCYPDKEVYFEITGWSKRGFLEKLRDGTSKNLRYYVERLRFLYAMQELFYTNKSLTDIAYDCGYSALSSFSRSIQTTTGLVPSK